MLCAIHSHIHIQHAYIYTTNSSVYWVTHSGARERTMRVARTGLDCVQMTTRCPWSPACIHTHTHTATRPHNAHTLARTDYQCKCNGNNDQYQCKWPCTLPKAHTDRTERYPIPSSNKNPVFGLIGQLDQT